LLSNIGDLAYRLGASASAAPAPTFSTSSCTAVPRGAAVAMPRGVSQATTFAFPERAFSVRSGICAAPWTAAVVRMRRRHRRTLLAAFADPYVAR